MIRVAICDDDISVLNQIQGFLDRYCRERSREIAHTVFHSPVELLDELGRQLAPYDCFLRVHRSYIVNLNYVQNISFRGVTMTSLAEIPIPRGKYNEIKDAFLVYAFRKEQVNLLVKLQV